jgi:valyl-tRNA synthetase
MPEPLPKAYDFAATEQKLYDMWSEKGYFGPSNDPRKPDFDPSKKPFVISIPPPNVTGELHLGHALFVSMEDLMIRYHRMKGVPTLWVPGSDHAGIATQIKVEKALIKEGTSREEIGREEFLKRTWAWKEKYGGIIQQQIRRLGASCDWSRERFTLDEGLSRAVREAFVRLYEKGLIYRGPRMINWSPELKTAVSDLEVDYSDEIGTLYYFKYVFSDNPEDFIPVATTRPETILGDTAVCVHPEDERYQKYIGRKVIVPILGREIPVIADEYVTREFGTGALKITPAHDPNDYALAQKHNLQFITMLDENACVNENGGPYQGMERFVCRKKLWEDMRLAGLVIKEEPYKMTVPRSQRGGELIEPMISTQWFVKIEPLAKVALEAVRKGEIKIVPDRFTKVYYNWLENIQDWCISRQLWWGHRIPVWYCDDCGKMTVQRDDPQECMHCHSKNIQQDPDVLDTWFSSGLWPFSTLGWPEKTPDLEYFYPTSIMETGYDILFFWVARMIMFGIEFTGKVPFHTVYLHGLIRDENGQKMSKSKGVAIDPLDLMNEYSTDALRFTMLVGSTPGNDTSPSAKKVEANRNFTNKLWNAGRFVIGALENAPVETPVESSWTLADSWIWARLQQLVRDVERLFTAYQYGEAGRQIYEFFWSEFADWYIEIAKQQMAEKGARAASTAGLLVQILDACLRMLHPFTPFVTEALWGHLKAAASQHPAGFKPFNQSGQWEDALIIARWPESIPAEGWETEKTEHFSLVQDIVRAIRNMRAEKNVTPGKRIRATIVSADRLAFIQQELPVIAALAHLDLKQVEVLECLETKPEGQVALVVAGVEMYFPLAEMVDLEAERARLEKELAAIQGEITRLETLLASSFGQKAPPAVVDKERQKLEAYRNTASKINQQLSR